MNNKNLSYIESKKKFISNKEAKIIKIEIQNKIQKKFKKKNVKLFNLRNFNKSYKKIKSSRYWKEIYDEIKNLKSVDKILIPRVLNSSKNILKQKTKIINKGIRIIEKSDIREYPFHQEYVGMQSKVFLVYWIALNKIPKKHGGLMISKFLPNQKLKHYKNKLDYPILYNQKYWRQKSYEKSFDEGELMILGKYVPHSTAQKKNGNPRWAYIVRVGI